MANKTDIGDITPYADGVLNQMREVLVDRAGSYADIADNSNVFHLLQQAIGVVPAVGMGRVQQHVLSNICTKLARLSSPSEVGFNHEDSWLDIANYAVLALAHIRRQADQSRINGRNADSQGV